MTRPLILPWNLPYSSGNQGNSQGNYQCTLPNIPEERKSGRKVLRTVRSVILIALLRAATTALLTGRRLRLSPRTISVSRRSV